MFPFEASSQYLIVYKGKMFNDLLRMRSCYSVALYNVCLITKFNVLCCVIANFLSFIVTSYHVYSVYSCLCHCFIL